MVLVGVCAHVYCFGLVLVSTGPVIYREMRMKGRKRDDWVFLGKENEIGRRVFFFFFNYRF